MTSAGPRILALGLAFLLVGCARDDADDSAQPERGSESSGGTQPTGVVIGIQAQRLIELETEALSATTWTPETRAYGRVVDPAPLAALVGELATAESASGVSERERVRVVELQRQDNASARTVEATEAAAVRDQWLVRSARDRIALTWGQAIAERPDLPTLLRALTEQRRAIVRIELPLGAALPDAARTARVTDGSAAPRSIGAEWVGVAPSTEAQLQGRGLLYLTTDNALGLSIGASVVALLPAPGEPLTGVRVPHAAVIRYAALPWVYVQTADTTFERMALFSMHPLPDGWLVPAGLEPGARVVTRGAQMLLSEELKGQIRVGD